MILRPVLLTTLAFTSLVTAQRGPLPGIPMVAPAVNHPALAAQPLMQSDANTRPAPAPAPAPAKKERKRPTVDPDTVGVKASGRELEKRVDRVLALNWGKDRADLEAHSAATGKPILYLQALGTLSGLA